MFKSIFITGLGGQGIVTLANMITEHASESGLRVSLFNSKGMAQRGGRVTSEIRMTSDPELEFGARISDSCTDILIGLEIGEAINSASYLKDKGIAILIDYAFVPTTMLLKKQLYPSLEQAREIFSQKTQSFFIIEHAVQPYNMFLLGVIASVVPSLDREFKHLSQASIEKTIAGKLHKGVEDNLKAFAQGYDYGNQL
jgi:indolepyruvate ferredoxin oxidoreductase beta subunit